MLVSWLKTQREAEFSWLRVLAQYLLQEFGCIRGRISPSNFWFAYHRSLAWLLRREVVILTPAQQKQADRLFQQYRVLLPDRSRTFRKATNSCRR